MKRRDTLMRLKRFRVDDLKRRMGTLDAMKADGERKLADLEDSVARERQRANDTDIGRLAFPSFLRSIEARRENLRATLRDVERERAGVQTDLTAAFQDLKALELATEQQAKRVAELETRRAQSRLDEMAIVRHLRKHAKFFVKITMGPTRLDSFAVSRTGFGATPKPGSPSRHRLSAGAPASDPRPMPCRAKAGRPVTGRAAGRQRHPAQHRGNAGLVPHTASARRHRRRVGHRTGNHPAAVHHGRDHLRRRTPLTTRR